MNVLEMIIPYRLMLQCEGMRIFYDARYILVENRFDGVSRYSHELAKAMSQLADVDMTWIIHDIRQLDKLPEGDHILVNDPSNALAELFLPRKLNKAGAKIVYSPFFVMGTLGRRYKLVLTIHDMIYFKHRTPPQWLPWHIRLGWWLFHLTYWPMRWQLNSADHVATVSNTACDELLAARATKRPITTVSNAVGDTFTAPDTDHHKKKGVVYIGAFTPYKNVECLIDAIALVPDVTLHLCGKLPPTRRPEIEQRLLDRGITERTILYNGATDEEYKQALADARCAISASRSEGFGLPLIEAQQAGVPFAAADTPIFREVGEDSALYFNPDSPTQAADCIQRYADKKTSSLYIKRGHKNAKRYTWNASADTALQIAQKLLQ